MIYPLIFLILMTARLLSADREDIRRTLYTVTLILLFIFSAFRLEVGCDWWGYLNQYELLLSRNYLDAMQNRDPVWWLLAQTIHMAGGGYLEFNLGASLIFFAGVHVFARTQPDPFGFLILLYPILIVNMPMSGMRQGAAIGCLAIAFTFAQQNKSVAYLAWVIIGAGFHASAAIFVFITPLVGTGFTIARLGIAAFLAVPGLLMLGAGENAQLAVSRYVNTGVDSSGAVYRIAILTLSAGFYLILLRRHWQRQFAADYRMITIGNLVVFTTLPIIFISTVIADRLGYYLIPFQAAVFSRLPFLNYPLKSGALTAIPYIFLLLVLTIWSAYSEHFHYCYLPYESWLAGAPEFYQRGEVRIP